MNITATLLILKVIKKAIFSIVKSLLKVQAHNPLPEHTELNLANEFSSFVVNKIEKIRISMDSDSSNEVDCAPVLAADTMSPEAPSLSEFQPYSEDNIIKLINRSATKSCPLDPIPTHLLKQCLPALITDLTNIVNTSLASGVFPEQYMTAMVTPLLKKAGLETVFKNYRPVSNLQFVSKLIERGAADQFSKHVTSHMLYEPFQSAYRQYCSTETALLRVANDILLSMDNQNVTLLVLLDMSVAFDTVDHVLLIDRLTSHFGVTGTAHQWFESYLSKRKQFVTIGTTYSELKWGVPQGSVLGPILFTAYTAPLGAMIRQHKIDIYMLTIPNCTYHLLPVLLKLKMQQYPDFRAAYP